MYINGMGLIKAENELNVTGMRRAGRFAKLAVAAARLSVDDSGMILDSETTGIILATDFGPHVTTFEFLDNILTYSEKEVSPTLFSHSVHNTAAFYIANNLKITGPTLTVTDFNQPFYQALLLANAWLRRGVCSRVLVGKVEEKGRVMNDITALHKRSELIFDEGALFLLLASDDNAKGYLSAEKLIQNLQDEKRLDAIANLVRL